MQSLGFWVKIRLIRVCNSSLRIPSWAPMARGDLYDVLRVDRRAAMEEVKSAFKKRALQCHPDKGGSTESFHLVYHAFEILADPLARERYDRQLAAKLASHSIGKKRRSGRARSKSEGGASPEPRSPKGPKGSELSVQSLPSLLSEVRLLLQALSRDARFQVIREDFSQKQREQFEKWAAERPEPCAPSAPSRARSKSQQADGCGVDAVVARRAGGDGFVGLLSAGVPRHRGEARRRKRGYVSKPSTPSTQIRGVRRKDGGYIATVGFDGLEVTSRLLADLPTAVEYLVILTAMKQKMLQDGEGSEEAFAMRVEQALVSAAREHGHECEDTLLPKVCSQHGAF